MKALAFALLLLAPAALFAVDSKVTVGQTLEETLEALGEPLGSIELREKTLLLYPQGEVALHADRVTDVDLMTDEEFAADQERLRLEREEWLQMQEKQAAARIEKGNAIKADKMQSRAFAALPAKDRVAFWRSFQIRYPEIDVSEEIARALEGYESELAELKSQHRIAELEARVAQAEQEAAAARLEAEKAKEEAAARSRTNYYGLRYYTDPVIHSRYYYRPPTITIYTDGEPTKHYWKDCDPMHHESTAERVSRILNELKGE